jgi:hypothetical protein
MKFHNILSVLSVLGSASAFAPTLTTTTTNSRRQPTGTLSLQAERKPLISGNWKLNPQTKDEAVTLAADIAAAIGPDTPDADVALFVPVSDVSS